MAETLTLPLRQAIQETVISPQLVLEIDGVNTVYGAQIITKRVKIGDDDLVIGGGWVIGGLNEVEDQSDLISWKDGTTTSIKQTLNQDKGQGSSISSMQLCLIDKDGEATRLVSPGVIVEDLLGRSAKVYFGVTGNTAFPEDFLVIFRGVVDDIQAAQGKVLLSLSLAGEVKKRQTIFQPEEVTLSGAYSAADDALVFNPMNFNIPTSADDMQVYAKFGDEYIELTSNQENMFLGVARAQLGSTAAALSDGDAGTYLYRLTGNVMDLALKLMLSSRTNGELDYFAEDLLATSVNYIDDNTTLENALYFHEQDLVRKYGVTVGDFLYIENSAESGNNGGGKWTIDEINTTDYIGTVLIVSNATEAALIAEPTTAATVNLLSRFNVLPVGLGLSPDEVDILEHERLKRLHLSSFEVDLIITEEQNGREFIERELYAVAGCYSLPRKARASVGIHSGPIPGTEIKVIGEDQIINASSLTVRRTTGNNFYNEIVYKYDFDLVEDIPTRLYIVRDEDSINRIRSGKKTLTIESRGLRASLNGQNQAQQAADRRINRYKFAAEEIDNVQLQFKAGFSLEIGDVFVLDGKNLNLLNSADGNRKPLPRLFECTNKSLDLRTGRISIRALDTAFSANAKYCLISPASYIKSASSESVFIIEESFNSVHGKNEYLKWLPWVSSDAKAMIQVRSEDFSRQASARIASISGNKITLATNLGFTPQAGDIMELAPYTDAPTEQTRIVYGWLSDEENNFGDGTSPYELL